MATVTPTTFRVIQVYGGLKAAYFEVETISGGDVIDFSGNNVSGIKLCILQNAANGNAENYTISGTDNDQVTLDSGSSATSVKGIVYYRSY